MNRTIKKLLREMQRPQPRLNKVHRLLNKLWEAA